MCEDSLDKTSLQIIFTAKQSYTPCIKKICTAKATSRNHALKKSVKDRNTRQSGTNRKKP